MTRGRKPLIALREAEVIGAQRGTMLLTPGRREDYFDLIVFENYISVFVRVKRSITHLGDPLQILAMYRREIIRIRSVPLTAVVARELWVRSPRGRWQFFRIPVDSIVEIRQDGTPIPGAVHDLTLIRPVVRRVTSVKSPVVAAEDMIPPPASYEPAPGAGDPGPLPAGG